MKKIIKLFGYNFTIPRRESVATRYAKHYKIRRASHICILCRKKAEKKKDGTYYRHCAEHRIHTNETRLKSQSYRHKHALIK